MFFMPATLRPPIRVTLEYDPVDMARRGRIGAYSRLAKNDAADLTKAARSAFLSKFEQEVDPDGLLPVEERCRRAAYARKAYFARLGRLSAKARSAQSSSTVGGVA